MITCYEFFHLILVLHKEQLLWLNMLENKVITILMHLRHNFKKQISYCNDTNKQLEKHIFRWDKIFQYSILQ